MAAVAAEVNLVKLKQTLLQAFSNETACEIDFVIRQLRLFKTEWSYSKSKNQLEDIRNLQVRIGNLSELLVNKLNKHPKLNPLIKELAELQAIFEEKIKGTKFGNRKKRTRTENLRF